MALDRPVTSAIVRLGVRPHRLGEAWLYVGTAKADDISAHVWRGRTAVPPIAS